MTNKTYAIKGADGNVFALVNAGSKNAALRHVAEKHFGADLASAADAIAATKAGIEVETAAVKTKGEAKAEEQQQ